MKRLVFGVFSALMLTLLANSALANGAPVPIPLSKLSGVVNFGSQQASGLAEVTVVEGDVSLVTQGLPRLNNELYQGWLVNSRTGERLSVAKFNVTADGNSKSQVIVTIGNREFDLFVVTVEAEPDPTPAPDERIVLAGYWPGRAPAGAGGGAPGTPGAAATKPAGSAAAAGTPVVPAAATIVSTALPQSLPRTGGLGFGVLGLGLLGLGMGAFVLGRGVKR